MAPAKHPADTGHLLPLDGEWSAWRHSALRGAGMPFDWLGGFADPADMDDDAQSEAVRRLLSEPRFLEALAWQNPAAMGTWIAKHARGIASGQELRRSGYRQALLARYAQRYCAKNDSIGFFGPVAWARFDDAEEAVSRTGSGGLRGRSTHFETWAIEAVAEAWAADERVAPHVPVRPHPALSVDGDRLRQPWRPSRQTTPVALALLKAARAEPGRADLVRMVADACGRTQQEVSAELAGLLDSGVLLAGFAIPLDERPEAALLAGADRVPDEALRGELVARFDELVRLCDKLEHAAGEPEAVHAILTELAAAVADITGRAAHRGKEQNERGRTPVYQDCRRDTDVVVAGAALDALRTPLALVLDTASWLSAEVADAVERELSSLHDELAARDGDVRLSELYFAAAGTLSGAPGTVVHDVAEDFRCRWAELLADAEPSADATELCLSSADIGGLVTALFPRRDPAWSGARHHSPDVLLGGTEENPTWVLGELHIAMNTLESRLFHTQAEHRAELEQAVAADMAGGRVVALQPNDSPEVSPRTYPPLAVHVPGRYVYWSARGDSGAPAGEASWPATGLRVSPSPGGLMVDSPDGSWRAPLCEVLGEFLSALVVDRFQIRPTARHRPRIVLDQLVISRRSWRFPAHELPFEAHRTGDLADLLGREGVPRHVFLRTPAERKPCYVDLRAPLLARNAVRMVRLARSLPAPDAYVEVIEMSPGPDELWLTDAAGHRYTSEFRLVAVDDRTAPPVVTEPGGEEEEACRPGQ